MTLQGWALIALFVAILAALTKPIGLWLFALYEGRRTPLHAVLGPVERGFYRLSGINPDTDQSWRRYAVHMSTICASSSATCARSWKPILHARG